MTNRHRILLLAAAGLVLLFSSCEAWARVALFRVQITTCNGGICSAHWNVGACVTIGRCGQDWLLVSSGHHLGGGQYRGTAQVCTNSGYQPARLLGTTWPDGPDLSVWAFRPSGEWQAMQLAEQDPAAGTAAGHVGMIGPQFMRKKTAVVSCGQDLITSQPAISGHSGGPIVSDRQRGEVLGIIWGTDNATTYSVPASQVREVARRFCPEFCRPTAPPAPPAAASPDQITIDYDRLAQLLIDRMAEDPRFKGPPGPAGQAGPPGAVPDLAQLRADLEQLKRHRRWVVLEKDGREVARESYGLEDPIVLDVQRIINQPQK